MKITKPLTGICLVLFIVSPVFWNCSGSMKSFETFERLEPIEDLPQPTGDHNLVVRIKNVADRGTSHKNWAELYINDKRIELSQKTVGYQTDYQFHFKLKSGVYKVRAVYYVGRKEYEISTEDKKVRVHGDRRTILNITLDKKLDGTLKSKKNFFEESLESFNKTSSQIELRQEDSFAQNEAIREMSAKTSTPGTVSSQRRLPADNTAIRRATVSSRRDISSVRNQRSTRVNDGSQVHSIRFRNQNYNQNDRNKITLQINSIPAQAQVFLNGRLIGTSPMNTQIDPTRNHVLQFVRDGYARTTKVLTVNDFQSKTRLVLRERLRLIK